MQGVISHAPETVELKRERDNDNVKAKQATNFWYLEGIIDLLVPTIFRPTHDTEVGLYFSKHFLLASSSCCPSTSRAEDRNPLFSRTISKDRANHKQHHRPSSSNLQA